MKLHLRAYKDSFTEIYSTKNDEAKGRLITLGSNLAASFYNVFITGIFYTGFLTMYGIDITGAGIISFIPYIASLFSLFSPFILERIKKRKPILLAAKIYFYGMYIVATNLMPMFVTDKDQRLLWFIIILFLAYSVYSLFSPGFTPWFYKFYPENNEKRTKFLVLNQIFSSVMSSLVLLFSGVITDAVKGSEFQDQLILGFRYVAFVLVLLDVLMQACAKEYPYPKTDPPKLSEIFTLSFKYKKFLLCMLLMFFWNFICNLNNGIWNYHLLNHLDFSYTLMNAMSVAYTFILVFTQGFWKKILRNHGWIKTFGIAVLLFAPTEIPMFLMVKETTWMWLPTAIIQNTLSVGLNFAYANIFYMNLPAEKTTVHTVFNSLGCNFFALLGMMTGTFISSLTGDNTIMFMGLPMYSVQFTTLARFITLGALGILLIAKWRAFTPQKDIEEIDELKEIRKQTPKRTFI
ncbi:MAG: MFS transporter [Clostridia bacterium]|nr:MFS transporter [Clostridia bacterium]